MKAGDAGSTMQRLRIASISRFVVASNCLIATGVRFACVLADAGYGLSAPFRHGLTARNLAWAVGIPRHLKVYPVDVRLLWPVVRRGRPRRRHVPGRKHPRASKQLLKARVISGPMLTSISWREAA